MMKRLLKIFGILIAVLIVVAVVLPFVIDANQFRPTLESKLTAALGREVKLGDLKLSLFSGSVAASDLSIADDTAFSKTPFLRAKSLQVGVELMPLITSKQLNVTGITIDQPEVDLWQNPQGAWNFSTLGSKSAAPAAPSNASSTPANFTVKLIKISNGRFSLGDTTHPAKPEVLEKVNLELQDFSPAAAFPFSLDAAIPGGGALKLSGKAGPINDADVSATPFDATLSVSHFDLLASGFVNPATGLSGIAAVDGSAASHNDTVSIKGKLTAENLVLAKGGKPTKEKVELDLALAHNMKKRAGRLEQGAVHIGEAQANLSGTYEQHDAATSIQMKLSGPKMPVDDLASMLPALNIALPNGASLSGGTATVDLNSTGPLDRLVSSGSLSVDGTTLKNFDLGTKLSALEKLAGIQTSPNTAIQILAMNVNNSPEGTKVDQINLVVPSIGTLNGSGTVSPKQELDFHMTVAVHTSGAALAALGATGDTSVPLTVMGTASDPVFRPDIRSLANQKIKQLTNNPQGAADAAQGIINLFRKKQ